MYIYRFKNAFYFNLIMDLLSFKNQFCRFGLKLYLVVASQVLKPHRTSVRCDKFVDRSLLSNKRLQMYS